MTVIITVRLLIDGLFFFSAQVRSASPMEPGPTRQTGDSQNFPVHPRGPHLLHQGRGTTCTSDRFEVTGPRDEIQILEHYG
jgi:hypothetical protein